MSLLCFPYAGLFFCKMQRVQLIKFTFNDRRPPALSKGIWLKMLITEERSCNRLMGQPPPPPSPPSLTPPMAPEFWGHTSDSDLKHRTRVTEPDFHQEEWAIKVKLGPRSFFPCSLIAPRPRSIFFFMDRYRSNTHFPNFLVGSLLNRSCKVC